MRARIIIGSNLGDEGKGTVVANYAKQSDNVLNVLTNGGAQRGHSILTKDGSITYQHFGSGTYYGADTYYSRFFILNPMQFVKEIFELQVKPKNVYRDKNCRWSTIYDMMANSIENSQKKMHATCGMGIWNTIKRYRESLTISFDDFMDLPYDKKINYLSTVKKYYENKISISESIKTVWDSEHVMRHFIMDCAYMKKHTIVKQVDKLSRYNDILFENGQGLLLTDTGKDTYDTTPSCTGKTYAIELLHDMKIMKNGIVLPEHDVTLHYVTRPYLTRHGDGYLDETSKSNLSHYVDNDRTNKWNEFQGEFRYGKLDIDCLKDRVLTDSDGLPFEIELTHCDEMDRLSEFKNNFKTVNTYDSPIV